MHPSIHALNNPEKPAFIMAGSGYRMSFGKLESRANRVAQLLRSHGVMRGDTVALMLENVPAYFEIMWGCQRAGVYAVPISARLVADEVVYILTDCGARMLFHSASLADVAEAAAEQLMDVTLFAVDSDSDIGEYAQARDTMPDTPIADRSPGSVMLYSSGTTGRPKGIKLPLPEGQVEEPTRMMTHANVRYDMDEETIYLSPAPLYHAAPLRWAMTVQALGGTVIVMEKFDAEEALHLVEAQHVTHAQFVPTHFVRMLALPEHVRERYDLSSLHAAIHAAAPCPVQVKEQMMAWWGPIIHEYYAGSESNGITVASPEEWLTHKGTVGRAFGCEVHICDENGEEVPPRTEGAVYFANGPSFEYHNDPEKTVAAHNARGWTTMGDIGWLDEEGFLYLTDRKSFMIISGGVNVYPQEIENLLLTHAGVADAAVFGAPDPDLGEKVVAVIQASDRGAASQEFAEELHAYLQGNLSRIKSPKRIDFMYELPRLPTGKLMKRLLQDAYRGKNADLMREIIPGK